MVKMLEKVGCDHIIAVDIHKPQYEGFSKIPFVNLDPTSIAAEYFTYKKLYNPVIVSPDVGASAKAHQFRNTLFR